MRDLVKLPTQLITLKMKNINKKINWDLFFSSLVLFPIFRFVILQIVITYFYIGNIYDDCTNDFNWYLVAYILPILLSILTSLFLKWRLISEIGKIFLIFFIAINYWGATFNKQEVGYYFKRPIVFEELKNADRLLNAVILRKHWDDSNFVCQKPLSTKHIILLKESPKMRHNERVFYAFQESPLGENSNYTSHYNEATSKIPSEKIDEIQSSVYNSGFLDKPNKKFEKSGNQFDIQIVNFENNSGKEFYIVTIKSGVLKEAKFSGVYEFLFDENGLRKRQKYYYSNDIFVESTEYPLISHLIELLFLCFSIVLHILITLVKKGIIRGRLRIGNLGI